MTEEKRKIEIMEIEVREIMKLSIEPIDHETFRNPVLYEYMTALQTATKILIKGGGNHEYLNPILTYGENFIKGLDMEPFGTQRIDVGYSLVVIEEDGFGMMITPDEDLYRYLDNNPMLNILPVVYISLEDIIINEVVITRYIWELFFHNLATIAHDTGFELSVIKN